MHAFRARYVRAPWASTSTSATVQAPQSPSAHPSFVPVFPVARSHCSSVVFDGPPVTVAAWPLTVSSKEGERGIASAYALEAALSPGKTRRKASERRDRCDVAATP